MKLGEVTETYNLDDILTCKKIGEHIVVLAVQVPSAGVAFLYHPPVLCLSPCYIISFRYLMY